jgi:heavy metal translocating P-type ATPase
MPGSRVREEAGGTVDDRARDVRATRPVLSLDRALLVATSGALATGAVLWLAGNASAAGRWWAGATVVALVPAVGWVVSALRRGQAGVDLVAVLSLVGTLAVQEYLAGALIALMLSTGRALEGAAERRASRDLRALLDRAPRTARRRVGGEVQVVALAEVAPGDQLVVAPGEVVPVDGLVEGATAVLDESALTGESVETEVQAGDPVRSGVVNAGSAFALQATATAEESTYAGLVRLAREAGAQSAPTVRLADRYAVWFLPLSLGTAALAWAVTGSVVRAVAVLVVATPCPLLLAAPVAIVSGLSRASRLGVVVRGGGALEDLADARTMTLDKTGTVTAGRPVVVEIMAAPGQDPREVLRLCASADQLSPHVLARAIVAEARARNLQLTLPTDVVEEPGRGLLATLDGRRVEVCRRPAGAGEPWERTVANRAMLNGAAVAWLLVDGRPTGAVLLRDPLRADAPRTLRRLRAAGIRRLVMLTGDRVAPAQEVGAVLGLDEVRAEQTPADKVAAVRAEAARAPTVMVGDGINDAPALAAATVGVAMGSCGSTAASEVAGVVLTADRLDRLADAMTIARRARRIAVQSAIVGMALSLAAMAVAAFGLLPPAPGALVQEAIDVAVILNALRALRPGRHEEPDLREDTRLLLHRFAEEHDQLRDTVDAVRAAADDLVDGREHDGLATLRRIDGLLTDRILPHEQAEETQLYPALAEPLGGEATAPMSRSHAEINRLAGRLRTHLEIAQEGGEMGRDQLGDVLACLYGLHAVLRLHFLQEEESYFALDPGPSPQHAQRAAMTPVMPRSS